MRDHLRADLDDLFPQRGQGPLRDLAWQRQSADQTTLPTIAAGQTAVVARLRTLATRLEGLSVEVAADVLVLIEPALQSFEQHAALALERAPAGPS